MTAARHKLVAPHRWRRRLVRGALPVAALVATGAVVGIAVALPLGPAGPQAVGDPVASAPRVLHTKAVTSYLRHRERRGGPASRSAKRVTLRVEPPVPRVTGHRWTTAPLDVWPRPRSEGSPLTVLPKGSEVSVTGVAHGAWAQIVRSGVARYVHAAYLVANRPAVRSVGPVLSMTPCASGSSVESGLVPDAVALHRAVCAHFPQVTAYGGWRPDGEHADGHAIDMMVYGDHALGQQIADWVRANSAVLKVDDIIWSQHIWTPVRAAEGWRPMPDRGSVTANHYDHVHVRVY